MDIEERGGDVGDSGVIVIYKPFEMADLLARVRGLLQDGSRA
jgi:DNA-binding response OmpR family regulator